MVKSKKRVDNSKSDIKIVIIGDGTVGSKGSICIYVWFKILIKKIKIERIFISSWKSSTSFFKTSMLIVDRVRSHKLTQTNIHRFHNLDPLIKICSKIRTLFWLLNKSLLFNFLSHDLTMLRPRHLLDHERTMLLKI